MFWKKSGDTENFKRNEEVLEKIDKVSDSLVLSNEKYRVNTK